jgi:hypothetical protein
MAGLSSAPVLTGQSPAPAEWPRLYPEPVVAPGFRATTFEEFQWRDGGWLATGRKRYEYEASGRLTRVSFEADLNGKWHVGRRETLTYTDGRATELLVEESIGPSLRNRGRHSFVYSGGRLTEERVEAWSFEERWTPLRRSTFEYDARGRLSLEVLHAQPGATQPSARIESRYETDGRLKELARQSSQRGAWIDTERIVNAYGTGGRLASVSMLSAGRGSADWMEAFRVTHEYDAAGRRTVLVTQTAGPAGLRNSARQLIGYDSAGNQIETRHQGWRDGAWIDGRKETWTLERSAR